VICYVQFSGSLFDTVANNNRDVERKNGGFDDEVGLYFPPILSTTVFELFFSSVSVWAWSGVAIVREGEDNEEERLSLNGIRGGIKEVRSAADSSCRFTQATIGFVRGRR
jgi:hypothetical protein